MSAKENRVLGPRNAHFQERGFGALSGVVGIARLPLNNTSSCFLVEHGPYKEHDLPDKTERDFTDKLRVPQNGCAIKGVFANANERERRRANTDKRKFQAL